MIILDTHAWIWWVSAPARLGRVAQRSIDKANRIGIPAICCFEVATLAAKGRIGLDRPPLHWMQDALTLPRVELLTITPAVAVMAAELPALFPGDPADRLIAATALVQSASLVTKDERLQAVTILPTVW